MQKFDFYKKDFDWQKFIGKPYHKYLPDKKNMAYNKFTTLQEALERLNLQVVYVNKIVDDFEKQPPSDFLRTALQRGTPQALKIQTEKVRSELIVSPIIMEIWVLKQNTISFFSGTEFKVDVKRGLTGRCDFIFCQGKQKTFVQEPVLTIVEAKKDNVSNGLGQCVAEMYAAQLFNEQKGKPIKTIYGAITTGINWLFLKLEEQTVYVEELERVYDFERNLDELLGLLMRLTETQN
jgi:hypothetical protein